MKHKRTAAMLLAVMLLLTLCACGKSAAPDVTPTPEPTSENQFWSRPTVVPETDDSASYGDYKVGNLIEDTWAADN